MDILRERVEADIERVLGPLFEMLAAERGVVVGMGEFASLEFVPDWSIRLQAIREVLDRSYGRPRQTIAHTGEEHGAPIEIELSEATASAAHEFLRAVKAARK